MDIRLEILRIAGVWTLIDSGPERFTFEREDQAIEAGVARAREHHDRTGGAATVHLWHGANETLVFDTSTASSTTKTAGPLERRGGPG